MGAGLWPRGAALGARGWLCVGLRHWRWLGRHLGGMVVVMTKDEALKLALEALKTIDEAMPFPVAKLAIKECKAALEAKDEPVAWMYPDDLKRFETSETFAQAYSIEVVSPTQGETVPLYTTPPQRTWVGLTDSEIGTIAYNVNPLDGIRQFARAIEAKLKEKNT